MSNVGPKPGLFYELLHLKGNGAFYVTSRKSQCARDVVDTVALRAGDAHLCTGLLLMGPLLPGEAAGVGPP